MAKTRLIDPPGAQPVLSENAVTVLRSRYLIKDEGGNIVETPGQLFSRVARLIAENEANYGRQSLRWTNGTSSITNSFPRCGSCPTPLP